MTQPLRIGYLAPQFPGQTHIFFWREIKALEDMGVQVELLSTRKPPQGLVSHNWSAEAMARTTYLGKINPVQAAISAAKLLPQGLPKWMLQEGRAFAKDSAIVLSAAHELVRVARERGIDHVHIHSCARAALIGAYARAMGGPRYSITLHGFLPDYGTGQRFKWSRAAFATVITQDILDSVQEPLSGAMPPRVVVQPMGVDVQELRRDDPYTPVEPGRPMRIFTCARLNVVKGHADLMSAVRKLLDDGVDVRLEIAGEDDVGGTGYRLELEEHLKKLRLQDHVTLLGAIDADAVKEKLLDAHLFVLASWREPLGVAYMEAMACGVPTIGTDAGGAPELILDGKTGRLVPPQNPDELAKVIREMDGDPQACMRYSAAGRAHIEANYSATRGAKTLVEEITRAASDNAG